MTGLERLRRWTSGARDAAERNLPRPVRSLLRWLASDEFLTTSASLAFYSIISLPPMVLIAFWAAGAAVSEEALRSLGGQVEDRAPDELAVGDVVRGLIEVAADAGALAVLAAVWPATAYGAALGRAFGRAALESPAGIKGWRGRALALVLIAALPFVVFAAMAALYVVPRVLGSGPWLTVVLAGGSVAVLALLVALVYTLFRVADTAPSDVLAGAALTAALFAVVTAGYLLYLEMFADFTQRYGRSWLATAVLLGLWLLLGNAVLLAGYRVMLRRAHHRRRTRQSTRPHHQD